jgi:hypothetical protein
MTRFNKSILAATIAFACAAPSQAGLLPFAGDTTLSPTFNRPVTNGTALSGVGTAVRYDVIEFYSTEADTVRFETLSARWSGQDTMLFLYTGFNPASPLSQFRAGHDDIGPSMLSRLIFNISANTQYQLVITSFENAMFGAYTGEISSEVMLTLGRLPTSQGNVPLPGTVALLGLGLGLCAVRARRSA